MSRPFCGNCYRFSKWDGAQMLFRCPICAAAITAEEFCRLFQKLALYHAPKRNAT